MNDTDLDDEWERNREPPGEWADQGLCRDHPQPDLWFPERGASTAQAKDICRACPVQVECLTYALNNGERFGIWGGRSERERRRIRHHANPTTR